MQLLAQTTRSSQLRATVMSLVVTFACLSVYLTARIIARLRSPLHAVVTSPNPLPAEGPGGPILILYNRSNPFSLYYSEILQAEGLNEFAVEEISEMTQDSLTHHDTVILGETLTDPDERNILYQWVNNGGRLIAMRPDPALASMLGMGKTKGELTDAYLAIDPRHTEGVGLVKEAIQYHGTADRYTLQNGEVIAALYSDAKSRLSEPAIASVRIGAGQAVVFVYDLAKSVVYTRQGNPKWSGMERDGIAPMRSDDLFYGAAKDDKQPDWVDASRIAIPQADEQQRLLVNLILKPSPNNRPLPRFWYFPRGLRAVVVMTGDDHGHGGTVGRFKRFENASTYDCSLDEWQCVRGTSNIFPDSIKSDDAQEYVNKGFEIGLHVYTGCKDWPQVGLRQPDGSTLTKTSALGSDALYTRQLARFAELYPGIPPPSTTRTDCITWGDFDTQPQVELKHGIRLDTNYYFWPPQWVKDQPGVFTGSGLPMRFAKQDGSVIDVYQAATQMTDESGQTYPYTIDSLLDNALGPKEFVGAFTANMHTDRPRSDDADQIVSSARARKVPVVSAIQMLRWLDGRNGSFFSNVDWKQGHLRFVISTNDGSVGIQTWLPLESGQGTLTKITKDGILVNITPQSFAGLRYASFPALAGPYEAIYSK